MGWGTLPPHDGKERERGGDGVHDGWHGLTGTIGAFWWGQAGEGAIGEGGDIIVEIRRDLKHCVKENDREDDKVEEL